MGFVDLTTKKTQTLAGGFTGLIEKIVTPLKVGGFTGLVQPQIKPDLTTSTGLLKVA